MEIRDYYTVLGVSREANLMDIENAYNALKQKARTDPKIDAGELDKAFEVLKSPNLKRKYDADLSDGKIGKYHPEALPKKEEPPEPYMVQRRKRKSALRNPLVAIPLLLGLLIALMGVLYWQFGHLVFSPTYSKDTYLMERRTGSEFGKVLAYESAHAFPGGQVFPAYQLRLASDALVWYRKDEINRLCKPSPPNRTGAAQ